jgi:hypothetical protein
MVKKWRLFQFQFINHFPLAGTLNWKIPIDLRLSKMNTEFYTIKTLKQTLTQYTLIMVYFTYFHSVMNYGIIFWGNSGYSNKIFILQKGFWEQLQT